jgi:superfamily II DNA/RNA helicase
LAKLPYVIEHVKEIEGKVVIFAHHKSVVSKLKEALGNEAVLLVGDTKQSDRQVAVDEFQNNPNIKYFIGSIIAAGVGITLTASSNVVFAELDWVPGNITQAEDRCHRFGTLKNVLVQHLVLEGSLDAKMAKTLIKKQEVIDKALDVEYALSIEDSVIPDEVLIPREEILSKEAEVVSEEEKTELLKKLKILASLDSDRALAVNGVGFSKFDSSIGNSLASQIFLTNRQAVVARKLVNKYGRQLNYDD